MLDYSWMMQSYDSVVRIYRHRLLTSLFYHDMKPLSILFWQTLT